MNPTGLGNSATAGPCRAGGTALALAAVLAGPALLLACPARGASAHPRAGHEAVPARLVARAAAAPLADPRADTREAELARTGALLEAATERARAAIEAYRAAADSLPAAQDRLDRARGVVIGASAAARAAHRAEQAAVVTEAAALLRLEAANAAVERQRQRVGQLASAAYKGTGMLALGSVFDATGPRDMAERLGYLESIGRTERRALDGFLVACRVARQARGDAEQARQAAALARQAADGALAEAEAARDSAQRATDELAVLIGQRDRAVAAATVERAATLARYEALKRDSEAVAGQLRTVPATGTGAAGSIGHRAGYLRTPVDGWKSSDFGMRFDPYYQVWQVHAGVDIAAGGGAPIVAAADGRVVRAGWNGGYGNFTCVYHGLYQGEGLATCYGHQSAILVSPGAWVRRGQVIGRVGSTGASTGHHLHFEVRLGGRPVEPLEWLPTCLC